MIVNFKISLEQSEYSALGKLALEDLRAIPEQARFIIRQELERRGMLSLDTQPTQEGRTIHTGRGMTNA